MNICSLHIPCVVFLPAQTLNQYFITGEWIHFFESYKIIWRIRFMLWGTGVVSDKQFINHLGKNIFIWPFTPSKLKGSTYNLTASKIAYYKENGENISIVDEDNVINIPARKTVLIQTEESIYVGKNVCGTYHTKVKMVSMGLSSISTTLDPCYFGTSLIAINNQTDNLVRINVGETFCSLMLYKMRKASSSRHDNLPFRADFSSNKIKKFLYYEKEECTNCKEFDSCEHKIRFSNDALNAIKNEYKDWFNKDFRKNKGDLISKVKNYKANEINKKSTNLKISIAIGSIITFIMILLYTLVLKKYLDNDGKIFNLTRDTIFSVFIIPASISIFTIFNNFFKR